jgi:enhancer of polycomb-like protein
MRYGRGGRILLDRRNTFSHSQQLAYLESTADTGTDPEYYRKIAEKWRFDADDQPSNGPENDEQDRVLIDDFDSRYGNLLGHGCCMH